MLNPRTIQFTQKLNVYHPFLNTPKSKTKCMTQSTNICNIIPIDITRRHTVKYVRHIVVGYSHRLDHPNIASITAHKTRTNFKMNLINGRRPQAWGGWSSVT